MAITFDTQPSEELKSNPFTAPPHPSQVALEKSAPDPLLSQGNPHDLPNFGGNNLLERTNPTLYLPPLLSSLPAGIPPHLVQSSNPPLTTDSRLPHIDPASLSLHKSLHNFHPVTPDYAVVPYGQAFNWAEMELPEDQEGEWYVVAFRSKRKPGSDGGPLYDADKKAHEEAVQNGGLIMYWYGIPSPETGMNLATCVWQSRKHAIAANSKPYHVQAMKLAAASFEVYELERHTLRKTKGEKFVTVEPFNGGNVSH